MRSHFLSCSSEELQGIVVVVLLFVSPMYALFLALVLVGWSLLRATKQGPTPRPQFVPLREFKVGSVATPPKAPPSHLRPVISVASLPVKMEENSLDAVRRDGGRAGFVMWVPDYVEEEEENTPKDLVTSKVVFSFRSESDRGVLMRKPDLATSLIHEMERERLQKTRVQVGMRVSKLTAQFRKEHERWANNMLQTEKRAEETRQMYRQLDLEYQRKLNKEIEDHMAILDRNFARIFNAEEIFLRRLLEGRQGNHAHISNAEEISTEGLQGRSNHQKRQRAEEISTEGLEGRFNPYKRHRNHAQLFHVEEISLEGLEERSNPKKKRK